MNTRTLVMISAGALFLGGCGGADPSSSQGPSAQGSTSAATPDSLSISGFAHASDGTLLRGASVCLKGQVSSPACTTTGSDGAFVLGAASYDLVEITFSKAGFLPTLRPIATRASNVVLPEGENTMMPVVVPQTFMGSQTDPTKGHIEFAVLAPSSGTPSPVVATLTDANGDTPPTIYLDASGAPTTAATGGTSGGFANLAPGVYILRFASSSAKCSATSGSYGYPLTTFQDPTSGQAAVIVPVAAGTVTGPVGVACSQ
jgi:hypothetical protein